MSTGYTGFNGPQVFDSSSDFGIYITCDPVVIGQFMPPPEGGGARVIHEIYLADVCGCDGIAGKSFGTLKIWNHKGTLKIELVGGVPDHVARAYWGARGYE